jgi:hypothetical protein
VRLEVLVRQVLLLQAGETTRHKQERDRRQSAALLGSRTACSGKQAHESASCRLTTTRPQGQTTPAPLYSPHLMPGHTTATQSHVLQAHASPAIPISPPSAALETPCHCLSCAHPLNHHVLTLRVTSTPSSKRSLMSSS